MKGESMSCKFCNFETTFFPFTVSQGVRGNNKDNSKAEVNLQYATGVSEGHTKDEWGMQPKGHRGIIEKGGIGKTAAGRR